MGGSFKWAGFMDGNNPGGGTAIWAPDIIYNPNYDNGDGSYGAYIIYYCTSSDFKRGCIGLATSKTYAGPYTYKDTIIYSGFNANGKDLSDLTPFYDQTTYTRKADINYHNTNIDELISSGKIDGFNSNWVLEDGSYNITEYPQLIDPGVFFDKDGKMLLPWMWRIVHRWRRSCIIPLPNRRYSA